VRYFSDEPELSPFLKALNEVRRLAAREGFCYQHVQAITVSIDQYAEAATPVSDLSRTNTSLDDESSIFDDVESIRAASGPAKAN
jgi:hypothetical protein